jgi:ATP-binding cassette subfamily B (MDR/TAP) protein 1
LFFGEMIDGVADTGAANGEEDEFNALQKNSLFMVYIGCGLFFIGWA